jgi:ribosomal protein L20A (L18A)
VDFDSLEFSETGEFCKAVRAKEDVDADTSSELPSVRFKQAMLEAERSGLESRVAVGGGGGKLAGLGASGVASSAEVKVKTEAFGEGSGSGGGGGGGSGGGGGGAGGAGGGDDDDEEEDEDDDEEEEGGPSDGKHGASFMYERQASSSMAAVLDMARNRGMLRSGEEVTAGRIFDTKGAGLHHYGDTDGRGGDDGKGGGPSFNLDHYDEYGRKMTQKQAFRQLSWKFHGKAPSKKNREKRMLEVEKQLADKTEDKAMNYLHALQAAQQTTKSAHIVLTGINAIKPSEVRRPADGGGAEPKKKKSKP